MPPVPLLRSREAIKGFQAFGWDVARQRGSHIATLSIPDHDRVARGTLRSLIHKAGLTVEEFVEGMK